MYCQNKTIVLKLDPGQNLGLYGLIPIYFFNNKKIKSTLFQKKINMLMVEF